MGPESGVHYAAESTIGGYVHGRNLACSHCAQPLECVEQNRRSGTWLGSFICPNCRSEFFYAYRWGQLVRKA
jgi:hypothetical protein